MGCLRVHGLPTWGGRGGGEEEYEPPPFAYLEADVGHLHDYWAGVALLSFYDLLCGNKDVLAHICEVDTWTQRVAVPEVNSNSSSNSM